MSDKRNNVAAVNFSSDSSAADGLLKMLDKINDKARDLTYMFMEQGILPDDAANDFRLVSHKMMKKRIKLMYPVEDENNDRI